jgi:hypothetical protein
MKPARHTVTAALPYANGLYHRRVSSLPPQRSPEERGDPAPRGRIAFRVRGDAREAPLAPYQEFGYLGGQGMPW